MYDPPPPSIMGGRFSGFLLGKGGFFMGIGYIILYFFVLVFEEVVCGMMV